MMKWSPLDSDDFIYFDIFSDLNSQLSDTQETEDDRHHVITSRCYCRGIMLKEVGIPRMPHGMKSRSKQEDLISLEETLKMLPKRRGRGRAKMLEEREDHFDLHVGRISSLNQYLDVDQGSLIDSSSAKDEISETSSMFGDCELSDSNTDDTTSDILLPNNHRKPLPVKPPHTFRKPLPVTPFNTECDNDFPCLVDSDSSTSLSISKPSATYRKRGRRKTNSVRTLENNKLSKSSGLQATAEIFVPKNMKEKHDAGLGSDIRNCDRNSANVSRNDGLNNLGNSDKNIHNNTGNKNINHGISNLGNQNYNSNSISRNEGIVVCNYGNNDISNSEGSDSSNHGISNHGNNDIISNGGNHHGVSNHSDNRQTVAIGCRENSDSTSDSRNISWNLSGNCVVQLEGVPLSADLNILEETLQNFGQLTDSECCVVDDFYVLRYRFREAEECEWVVSYLHDTDMLYPESPVPLTCFRV